MPEIEIRRIRESDAATAVQLWDRMCRETPDGGPLTPAGRGHLARMLAVTAWHRDTFCLVVARGDEVLGFGLGRLDTGDGLLPGAIGELLELYVPDHPQWRTPLADAVTARLRELGAGTLRKQIAADDPEEQRFWADRGFTADMVVLSNYQQ